ncbi:hypothetical protein KR074_005616, partial [Drosophila pseudoananassae]
RVGDTVMEGPSGSKDHAKKPLEFGVRFSDEAMDEEDEWSDFTEENRRQYTNLPRTIQMSLSCGSMAPFTVSGEVKVQESEQRESGGDGPDIGQGPKEALAFISCPWKLEGQISKTLIQPGVPQKPVKLEKIVKTEKPLEAKRQVYVPPALRHSQGEINPRPQTESRLRKAMSSYSVKQQAPDLSSPEYFPSLGGSRGLKRAK